MKLVVFLSILVAVCANDVDVDELQQLQESKEAEAVIQHVFESMAHNIVTRAVGGRDPINIPYFPMIATETISLSMSDFEFGGFTDIKPIIPNRDENATTIGITWPAIRLNADGYVAGGHIERVPFVGRSAMKTTIVEMTATMSYEKEEASADWMKNLCATPNTTIFEVTMDHLSVRFEDLNPGEDTGEVVNSMISSIGPDIVDAVTNVLNGPLAETLDNIGVALVNNVINKVIDSGFPGTRFIDECEVDSDVEEGLKDLPYILNEILDELEEEYEAIGPLRNFVDITDIIKKMALRF